MEQLYWLLLAAIFIVIEIITLGLTTIWFAGGAFIAALAALAGANLMIQITLFLVISIVLLVLTRPIADQYLDSRTEKTNAEALVGKQAVVLQQIDNLKDSGQVKVNGMEWTARSKEDGMIISESEVVNILDIQGVKLIVEPAISQKNDEKTKK